MNDILLIDFSGIAHALWHVTGSDPNPTSTATAIVAKVRALAGDRRSGVGICLDSGKSFRHELSPGYKANRSSEDRAPLYHQIGLAIETLKGDGFPMLEAKGFEADDVIATVVGYSTAADVVIASADKDLLQLVGPYVTVHSTRTGATVDAAAVKAKFGVEPHQMCDYLTLVGDASDNVKGCPGVGEKTAAKLLAEFGNLDDMYRAFDAGATPNVTPVLRTKLQDFRAQMPLTRSLIQLRTDAPIDMAPLFVERVPSDVATFGDESPINRPDIEGSTMTMDEADAIIADIMPDSRATVAKAETITLIPKSEQKPVEAPKTAPAPEPTTAIALADSEVVGYERQLEPKSMAEAITLSKFMFESRMFGAYGTPQAVMSTILAGRELGLPAMASLRSFHVVEGKPTMAADAMRALVLKSGKAEYFRCTERTAERATFVTKRKCEAEMSLSYTIDEARTAGLVKTGGGWTKNPADMLVARASSKLCRLVYPDVTAGLYSPEEF